jgi:hypothetical protein
MVLPRSVFRTLSRRQAWFSHRLAPGHNPPVGSVGERPPILGPCSAAAPPLPQDRCRGPSLSPSPHSPAKAESASWAASWLPRPGTRLGEQHPSTAVTPSPASDRSRRLPTAESAIRPCRPNLPRPDCWIDQPHHQTRARRGGYAVRSARTSTRWRPRPRRLPSAPERATGIVRRRKGGGAADRVTPAPVLITTVLRANRRPREGLTGGSRRAWPTGPANTPCRSCGPACPAPHGIRARHDRTPGRCFGHSAMAFVPHA